MTVENYRSIEERIVFSMIPNSNIDTFNDHIIRNKNTPILKSAFIYGANAAGKTNIIRTIDFVKSLIVHGIGDTNTYNQHNRNTPSNINKPSIFEFCFISNNVVYTYGFAIILATNTIEGEWLYVNSPANKEELIFEREENEVKFNINDSGSAQSRLNAYVDDIKTIEPTLFLSEVAKKRIQNSRSKIIRHFNNAYNWFNSLLVITPDMRINTFSPFMSGSIANAHFVELIKKFDTGVIDLIEEPSSMEEFIKDFANLTDAQSALKRIRNTFVHNQQTQVGFRHYNQFYFTFDTEQNEIKVSKMVCKHKDTLAHFDLYDESDGTNRLFDLIPILFCNNIDSQVVFVDELDRSLHPNLVIEFVKLFFQNSKGSNLQLIATTHQAELMDLKLLRRDEIWIVDRTTNGSSKLYSLNEFRVDEYSAKAYLQGRYGGVPLFADSIVVDNVE